LKRFSRFRLEEFGNAYSDMAKNRWCGNSDRSCGKSGVAGGIKLCQGIADAERGASKLYRSISLLAGSVISIEQAHALNIGPS
jgi:hypothetical protein